MKPLRCLVNGREEGVIDVANRGLQYGDGLFETLPIQEGTLLLWPRHLERLERSAARLGMTAPLDTLTGEAASLAHGLTLAILKVMLVRRADGRGYRPHTRDVDRILTVWSWPQRPPAQDGAALTWCETRLARQPRLAGLKHLNRLEQVLAQQELSEPYWEGLMQDTEDGVIEGTMTNLFIVEKTTLVTPLLDQAGVRGVMRDCIMVCARDLGLAVREERVTKERVLGADEAFVCNSIIGICPIASLPGRHYGDGPVTQALNLAIREGGYAVRF